MFPIFNSVIKTATRMDSWDAPDHWKKQHRDYQGRRTGPDSEFDRVSERRSWPLFL